MHEKRFTIDYEEGTITDNGEYFFDLDDFRNKSAKEVVDCLNNLHEENEELKKGIGNLEHTKDFCAECCERLEKENEQLKSEIRKVQMAYVQLWMHKFTLSYEKGNWWAVRDGDITLWKEEVVGLLNELYEENNKIKTIILQKLKELEYDYERSAKAGMPTGSIIGEIYTFEEICKEMDWLDD